MNCWVLPAEIERFDGVTAREVNTGAVTVSVVEPLMLPLVAVIVTAPAAIPFAMPPDAIEATEGI